MSDQHPLVIIKILAPELGGVIKSVGIAASIVSLSKVFFIGSKTVLPA